ncbi:MAG: phosphatase PAP2 family protein [Pseudonocardiaceae bacterium]
MSGELATAAVAVLIVGVSVLTGLTARWVVGHPARIRAGLSWVAELRAVAWARSRYPEQWRLLGRLPVPGKATGVALTLGLGATLVLGLTFGQLLDNVLESDGIAAADRPVLSFLAAHREPWLVTGMQVVSQVGSPLGAAITATVVGGALACTRRSWLPLLIVGLGAAGIGMINLTVKWLVSRHRPPRAIAVLGEDGFSFPSGHTTGTTVVWLLSAWMVTRWVIRGRAGQDMAWTGALLFIVAVGASRVYLGVHFPSDVLAGWTLGAAWSVIIALVVNVWEQSTSVNPRALDFDAASRKRHSPL